MSKPPLIRTITVWAGRIKSSLSSPAPDCCLLLGADVLRRPDFFKGRGNRVFVIVSVVEIFS